MLCVSVSGSYLEWPLVPGFDRNKSAHQVYLRHLGGFCPSGFRRTDPRKADRGWRPTLGWGRPSRPFTKPSENRRTFCVKSRGRGVSAGKPFFGYVRTNGCETLVPEPLISGTYRLKKLRPVLWHDVHDPHGLGGRAAWAAARQGCSRSPWWRCRRTGRCPRRRAHTRSCTRSRPGSVWCRSACPV